MGGQVSQAGADASVEVVLEQFRSWLVQERGLAAETVRCYVGQSRTLLLLLPQPRDRALGQLDAAQVVALALSQLSGGNVWSAKAAVTAWRSFLRFAHLAGLVPVGLVGAVPAVAGWRLSALPRGLDVDQVTALLGSCDRATVVGRRDRAVLTVLARLGLRGGEVAALRLDDIDWRAGEVTVRGKASRLDRLPLPVEVGEAIVAYLTDGRPRCDVGTVFVTVRAPVRPLSPAAVRQIMGRACQRAGLVRLGAHRLRHTLASDLLAHGAPLAEVGQVLRHRSQLATTIYAKVDAEALRPLARPWPGATS